MFRNVLVGVDGRSGGRDAIRLAKQLANPDAEITLVSVYGDGWPLGRGGALLRSIERADSEQMLAREREAASIDAELLSTPAGSVGRALHELAEHRESDLIALGSCRRGLVGRAVIGDVTRASLNGAPCAVVVAPAGFAQLDGKISSIGIGYDGSPESEAALVAARALAPRLGATIHALSVISLESASHNAPIPENWPEIVSQLVRDGLARLHRLEDVQGDCTYGDPSEELAHFSEELGLLIVGSRSYGPLGRLFNGSTSNYLARRARCPLLVLPRSAKPAESAGRVPAAGCQPVRSPSWGARAQVHRASRTPG